MKSINLKTVMPLVEEHCKATEARSDCYQVLNCRNAQEWQTKKASEQIDKLDAQIAELEDRLLDAVEPIREAIKAAEGRASARQIKALDILRELQRLERRLLDWGCFRKSLNGLTVLCDPNAQKFPSAYRYTPESTHFEAEFKNGSWRINRIWRDICTNHKWAVLNMPEELLTNVRANIIR